MAVSADSANSHTANSNFTSLTAPLLRTLSRPEPFLVTACPPLSSFSQLPCPLANAAEVCDAILNGKLTGGRDGRAVSAGDHAKKVRLTIRHTDVKVWMLNHSLTKNQCFSSEIWSAPRTPLSILIRFAHCKRIETLQGLNLRWPRNGLMKHRKSYLN